LAKQIKLKDPSEQDIFILGIVSSENILKVSWAINQKTHTRLAREENISVIQNKTGIGVEFAHYSYEDETQMLRFRLISNKSDAHYFLEELKNIDYIFLIKGDASENVKESIIQELRKTEGLLSVLHINPGLIKKKEKLEQL
jgi:hypothetical protein